MRRAAGMGQFFGGPHDGAFKLIGNTAAKRGYLDVTDGFGHTVRYSVVPLETARQVEDEIVAFRLIPQDGTK